MRKIIHKWKTFKTVANLPRSGYPSKFIPRSDHAIVREIAKKQTNKKQKLHIRLYRPQLSCEMLKFMTVQLKNSEQVWFV